MDWQTDTTVFNPVIFQNLRVSWFTSTLWWPYDLQEIRLTWNGGILVAKVFCREHGLAYPQPLSPRSNLYHDPTFTVTFPWFLGYVLLKVVQDVTNATFWKQIFSSSNHYEIDLPFINLYLRNLWTTTCSRNWEPVPMGRLCWKRSWLIHRFQNRFPDHELFTWGDRNVEH